MNDTASFYRIADRTIAQFPDPFRAAAQQVMLRVTDWPPQEILTEMGIDDPSELTGLYDGVPMTSKSVADPAPFPDTVWLYREPILTEWRERGNVELSALIAHVTVHEFAHHFGWSDADIAAIDRWWE